MLRDPIVVAVVRTRPRAIPLVMRNHEKIITTRKSTHGFPFLSDMSMGLRLASLRVAGAPLLTMPRANSAARHLLMFRTEIYLFVCSLHLRENVH